MRGQELFGGEPAAYQSYLLRLWLVQCEGEWQWRASLQSPRSGEFQAFPDLEALVGYLRDRCECLAPCPKGPAQAVAETDPGNPKTKPQSDGA